MSEDSVFNVAIIGTGNIAQTVTDSIKRTKNIKVVAVASRDADRARLFAKKNRIVASYDSYDALISADGYDLVYISTINPTHYELAHKCLESNKPVLVEKPICLSSIEVQELVRLSAETGTFLAEAMPLRYSSNVRRAKEIIDSGAIGNIRLLVSNIGIDCWDVPRINEKSMGGGALFDLGIYGLTLSDMIFEGKHGTVKASCNTDNEVDSQNTVIISYDNAQSVLINSVKLQTKGCAVIYGEQGRIFVNKAYNAKRVVRFAGLRRIKVYKSNSDHYLEEIIACRDAIRIGKIEPDDYKHNDLIRIHEMMDVISSSWNTDQTD